MSADLDEFQLIKPLGKGVVYRARDRADLAVLRAVAARASIRVCRRVS